MRANTSEGIKAALKALHSPPMTDEERRWFDRLRRREMARAEAKRRQLPQLDLDEWLSPAPPYLPVAPAWDSPAPEGWGTAVHPDIRRNA